MSPPEFLSGAVPNEHKQLERVIINKCCDMLLTGLSEQVYS